MQEDEIIEIKAIVKGNVQGVGFRATARNHALHLGLKGSVRNLSDGSVEIFVLGPRDAVHRLLQALRDDFGLRSPIANIVSEEIAPHHDFNGFRIL